jgi:hypothetical protein
MLEAIEDSLKGGVVRMPIMAEVWDSSAAEMRKTARFKTYIRNSGIYGYWRARGFADLCRPVGGDDFECD